jgi:hypothetical protein
MKRKHREAMRAAHRLQDAYVDGVSEDEAALEAQQWHDEHVPQYEPRPSDRRQDEQLPF